MTTLNLTVTPQQVREISPDLTSTDAAIDLLIGSVSCKLDSCLNASYMDCEDLARNIKISTICHFATLSSRSGQVKSRRYANGASESYSNYVDGGRGLNGTQFGETILALDTAGCVNAAFPANKRQFIATAGTAGSRTQPFYFGENERNN